MPPQESRARLKPFPVFCAPAGEPCALPEAFGGRGGLPARMLPPPSSPSPSVAGGLAGRPMGATMRHSQPPLPSSLLPLLERSTLGRLALLRPLFFRFTCLIPTNSAGVMRARSSTNSKHSPELSSTAGTLPSGVRMLTGCSSTRMPSASSASSLCMEASTVLGLSAPSGCPDSSSCPSTASSPEPRSTALSSLFSRRRRRSRTCATSSRASAVARLASRSATRRARSSSPASAAIAPTSAPPAPRRACLSTCPGTSVRALAGRDWRLAEGLLRGRRFGRKAPGQRGVSAADRFFSAFKCWFVFWGGSRLWSTVRRRCCLAGR
mmetsp:Transcript_24447/g.61437  ORF Transcript_24447/g.61437 Transcript_24447/m.61437 type:complete len:323 (+) Transcript_24447:1313-2281(+)